MAYTKYSLTPANNTAAPPDGAPEGMLPSAVNDTMRDMMAQIRDVGDGIRDGTYTMTAAKITGGTITGTTVTSNTFSSSGATITGGTINGTAIGGTTAAAGKFTTLEATGVTTVQAGTVSAPAITTTGDTNTGIFFPAADTIAFTEGGVESMRITSAGNIGIGVTPAASTVVTLQLGTSTFSEGGGATSLASNMVRDTSWKAINTGTSGLYQIGGDTHYWYTAASASAGAAVALTERMRIDSSGNVGIGTSTITSDTGWIPKLVLSATTPALVVKGSSGQECNFGISNSLFIDSLGHSTGTNNNIIFRNTASNSSYSATERMRITSAGELLIGTTSISSLGATAGIQAYGSGYLYATVNNDAPGGFARRSSDGDLVLFRRDTSTEGTISVSGSTVSYNGGHLSRWSQLPDGSKDNSIPKGTVMSNLDDMCVWEKDGVVANNEQLNKMKVSDVEGDTNVAGVFVNWTVDSNYGVDDMNVAMTGDMIIRIAEGVVVQKGDLLMSAGNGTAKPQGDDIVRSKTIAKVTSNHVTCTYADGSYCVPCVLMAC